MFIRVDFNVPIKDGAIDGRHAHPRVAADDPVRARAGRDASILASHLGRPKGKPNPEYSLRPVGDAAGGAARPAGRVRRRLHRRAGGAGDRDSAGTGGVVLLENLRFHAEEEKNDSGFARQLAALADVYVNDAFGSAHRAHASTEGIVRHVTEAAAGLLMAKELEYLGKVLEDPERPFVAILGGAKVSDKLEVIENLLPRVDALLIGGAMAYTFLKARGVPVGKSLVEDDSLDAARDVERRAKERAPAARAARRSRRRAEARGRRAGGDARGRRPGDRRPDGPRHRPEDGRELPRRHRRREDGHLERPDGRVRDRRVRERHASRSRRRWRR